LLGTPEALSHPEDLTGPDEVYLKTNGTTLAPAPNGVIFGPTSINDGQTIPIDVEILFTLQVDIELLMRISRTRTTL
jgi:hypothetical protein